MSTKRNDGQNTYEAVFSHSFEEEAEHTVRLVPTGKFGFDALEIRQSGLVPKPEYVEGTPDTTLYGSSDQIQKSSGWGQWKDEAAGDYETYNNSANATLSYAFTGTGISMMTKFDGGKTGAHIYIDDKDYGVVNCTDSTDAYRKGIDIQSLPFGTHTFRLVTTGKFGFKTITTTYGTLEDRSALSKAVEAAKNLKESDYVSGWNSLQEALSEADFALRSYSFSQSEIDELTDTLNAAIEALRRPSSLFGSDLGNSVVKAITVLRTKDYDPDSTHKAQFTQALNEAVAGLLEDNATQAKTLNSALLAGIAAIQYPKIDFVLDALEMTVTKAESLLENRTEFPESSMDKLEEELSKARSILSAPQSQIQIDEQAQHMNRLLLSLRKVPNSKNSLF